ncbi:MAG: AmmeMemoRadiSam system protein B [Mailhella sp.]|nr:AmmeMemoRadiSam system protein B [Mailhella sp.]
MRKPNIAGTWYPEDPRQIESLFSPWTERPAKDLHPAALILPHAGYAYSGEIAAEACSHVFPGQYKKIIILAPSHRMAFSGVVSVEPCGEVETPFGPAVFGRELHERLHSLPHATCFADAHAAEHSIDIQLPLLRRFFPECQFGALLVGDFIYAGGNAAKQMEEIASALRAMLDKETLLVISTDFTHYGKNFAYTPFTEHIPRNMEELDRRVWEAFASGRTDIFCDFIRHTQATVCGASAMLLLLQLLPGQATFTRIDYANSGLKTGDWTHCVGYTAAAVSADWTAPLKTEPELHGNTPVSLQTGRILPMLARRQLQKKFGKPCNEFLPFFDKSTFFELQQKRAVFVTLTMQKRLRGCIGEVLPMRPLWQAVTARAISAAFEDSRFEQLRPEELGKTEIEVSVLTPPEAISSYREIVIGRHGVILQKNGRGAVFLPQVAPEQGWDVPTMLAHLSLKAGLPADAWKSGCQFFVFTAQVFHEQQM